MDLRQQHNVRDANSGQPAPQPHQQPQAHYPEQQTQGHGKWWWPSLESKIIVTLLIVASVAVLSAFALGAFGRSDSTLSGLVDQDGWQAVFLSNGQVYFGKITVINDKIMVLEDIYYLQVDQQIQPEQDGTPEQEPQVSLAKLGSELHGPQDQMFISMAEVVFWENLQDENGSDVVSAIQEHKSSNGQSQMEQQTQGQATPAGDAFENDEAMEDQDENSPLP